MNSYIITDSGISIVIDMVQMNIDESHPQFQAILDAVREGRWDDVPNLASVARALQTFCHGKIEVDVDNGILLYMNEEVHGSLVGRILDMMEQGFDVNPLVKFLDNLMQNPSKRSVDELYGFLEHGKMPITEDGHFLAYKRVRDDYKSVHDGKTDNSIGTLVSMPRNKVDDNKDRTCSHGLHFCSHEYLSSFSGSRVVVLKINPRDVVSIPSDYNNTKGRACQYLVIGELSPEEVEKALGGRMWTSTVNTDYDDRDTDLDNDFEDDELIFDADDFMGQDWYDDGYEDGKEDAFAGAGLDDDAYKINDDYDAGYLDGFLAVRTGDDTYQPKADTVQGEERSWNYIRGYAEGYSAGRHRLTYGTACAGVGGDDYNDGYLRGVRDGRGHKAKAKLICKV